MTDTLLPKNDEELTDILDHTDDRGGVLMVCKFIPETNEFGWTPLKDVLAARDTKMLEHVIGPKKKYIPGNPLLGQLAPRKKENVDADNALIDEQRERAKQWLGGAK